MGNLVRYGVQQSELSSLQNVSRIIGGLSLGFNDTVNLDTADIFASATSAGLAPLPKVSANSVRALATASITSVTIKVSVINVKATAIASIVSPGVFPSTDRSVTAPPAIGNAFIPYTTSPVGALYPGSTTNPGSDTYTSASPQTYPGMQTYPGLLYPSASFGAYPSSYTYPGDFLWSGEWDIQSIEFISTIIPKITVTANGVSTAAGINSVPNISITSVTISVSTASVSSPVITKTGANKTINHVAATAIASGIASTPKISVSSVAPATGGNTAPAPNLAIGIQQLLGAHTQSLNPPVIFKSGNAVINHITPNANASGIASTPAIRIPSVSLATAENIAAGIIISIVNVPLASTNASNSAPSIVKLGTNATINAIVASASATITVPNPLISVTSIATSSSAVDSPVVNVVIISSSASSTTSSVEPVITHVGENIFINPFAATADASVVAPVKITNVTSPPAISNASSVVATKIIYLNVVPISIADASANPPTITHATNFLQIFPTAANADGIGGTLEPTIVVTSFASEAIAYTASEFNIAVLASAARATASARLPFIPTSIVVAKGYGNTHIRARIVSARIYS